MLKKLQIRNYRRHRKLDIVFDKITYLQGPSGTGKTSAMGALKLVAFNTPSGDKYISWDSDACKVRLVAENNKITRTRSAKENTYSYNKEVYKAFGTGVPLSVKTSLKLTPLNFHHQHAGPFWFSETAGEVSRQLNKIVDLDVIDRTISNLNSEQRSIRIKIKDINERISVCKTDGKKLRFCLSMDEELKKLEGKEQKVSEIKRKSSVLSDLVKSGGNHLSQIDRDSTKLSDTNSAIVAGEKWAKIRKTVDRLAGLLKETERLRKITSQSIPFIQPVIDTHTRLGKAQAKWESLVQLVNAADDIEGWIKSHEEELKKLDKEFKEKMGRKCVLCGSPLKRS